MLLDSLKFYEELMTSFLNESMSVKDFESNYLSAIKNDSNTYGKYFEPLESAFEAVDAYCEDISLMDEFDIDEKKLREEITGCLSRLKQLMDASNE